MQNWEFNLRTQVIYADISSEVQEVSNFGHEVASKNWKDDLHTPSYSLRKSSYILVAWTIGMEYWTDFHTEMPLHTCIQVTISSTIQQSTLIICTAFPFYSLFLHKPLAIQSYKSTYIKTYGSESHGQEKQPVRRLPRINYTTKNG